LPRADCGYIQSWLMPRSSHRLRNDLKCVKWDVKPCPIQSTVAEIPRRFHKKLKKVVELFKMCRLFSFEEKFGTKCDKEFAYR